MGHAHMEGTAGERDLTGQMLRVRIVVPVYSYVIFVGESLMHDFKHSFRKCWSLLLA